ncbi:putative protein phosphatase 2C 9 [Vitis vinifera]|uniref:PPM-type phosphatase domain-containing protein n=1 Tax=Vitis vinifera TaxID=29760 RepID=A0A438KRV2_VITVI|nr:putative protein phosphatase 2C 9 [Vitis vinifera]
MEGEGNLGHWLPGLEGAFSIQIVICGILSAAYHCTTRKNYEDKLVKRTAKKGLVSIEQMSYVKKVETTIHILVHCGKVDLWEGDANKCGNWLLHDYFGVFGRRGIERPLKVWSSQNWHSMTASSEVFLLVMDNQEAVDIARKIKDPQKAAKHLTAEALRRESKDDISCVVVRFKGCSGLAFDSCHWWGALDYSELAVVGALGLPWVWQPWVMGMDLFL